MTPPLVTGPPGPCVCGCALTRETSYGFAVIDFARLLGHPLDPWEELAAIHGGELLPDGRPRFRILLLLVARQNGKTTLVMILALFWQFVEARALTLGTSTKLDYSKESWSKSVKLARKSRVLDALRPAKWTREANGEQESWTTEEARYKIAPANSEGGRSLTIDRLICDELRQHHTYEAWDAAEPAASPADAQIWALSNAGDDRSVVLNDHRDDAIKFIETGEGDKRLGLLEWSAPEHADPEDPQALAMANPNLGRRGTDLETLLAAAKRAKRKGGQALTGFKTERMCIRVKHVNPAIDPAAWARCLDPGDMDALRRRLAGCIDVSSDGRHVTFVVAGVLPDDRVRVEVVAAWDSTEAARKALPGLVARVRPLVLGWFPAGPGAELAADLADRRKAGRMNWPPPGVRVEEIRGETTAVCMAFAGLVSAVQVAHSNDPLLNDHVGGVEKLMRGDAWVFSRKGEGHGDAAYGAAGAVHLARTMPTPVGKPRLITVSDDDS
jgi:hypothetical protein